LVRNKMDISAIKMGDLVILDPHYLPGDNARVLRHDTVALVVGIFLHAYVIMFNNQTYDIRKDAVRRVKIINKEVA
jgi:hypothetical protein